MAADSQGLHLSFRIGGSRQFRTAASELVSVLLDRSAQLNRSAAKAAQFSPSVSLKEVRRLARVEADKETRKMGGWRQRTRTA